MTDIAILGGGAAGLAAACICRQHHKSVVILERNAKVGKKLLQTGNGRCNLTNLHIDASRYHGDTAFIAAVLDRFGYGACADFFSCVGLPLISDREGRVYPRSEQAASVLTLLRAYALGGDCREVCDFTLRDVKKTKDGFVLRGDTETITARSLIVCTGSGASVSAEAADAAKGGYDVLKSFGHTVTPLFPSLNAIKADSLKGLKGIRSGASVTLYADGAPVATRTGEVQFGDGTLSGICVFDLSRPVGEWFTSRTVNGTVCQSVELSLDLAADYTQDELKTLLFARKSAFSDREIGDFLTGFINNRLGWHLMRQITKKPPETAAKSLGSGELMALVRMIKDFRVVPTGLCPFASAQVTAGGVCCAEFDPATLASRRTEGLYAAGEVLNCDGDCGGFNLHWAWATGILAATAAARDGKESV